VELRQRKSKGKNSSQKDPCRLLCRDIIILAVGDLGLGTTDYIPSSRDWRRSKKFLDVCHLADWDHQWVEDILLSIEVLHTGDIAVRTKLTHDSMKLLREVAME